MNCEIKFRFWDEENNRFWNGGDEGESIGKECFQTFFENHCLVGAMGESIDVGFGECDFRVRELPKSQYTGLTDSKGVEIYEEDVIECHTFDELIEKKQIGLIEYNEGRHGFVFVPITMISKNLYYPLFAVVTCEVIGNIYQNPELLESK